MCFAADRLKRAEDGDGLILRAYEATGSRTPVHLRADFDIQSVHECDLMEEAFADIELSSASWHCEPGPFEIKTFRLRLPA